ANVGRAYSDFLNESGQANAPAPSTIFSPDVAQQLVTTQSNNPIPGGQRIVTFAPASYPVYSYRTRDGGAVSLFTATVDIQTTAAPGAAITPAQQLFDLMPGQRYQSESLKGIDLVGLNVPPAKSPALATSPAEYSGIISATGVPA